MEYFKINPEEFKNLIESDFFKLVLTNFRRKNSELMLEVFNSQGLSVEEKVYLQCNLIADGLTMMGKLEEKLPEIIIKMYKSLMDKLII